MICRFPKNSWKNINKVSIKIITRNFSSTFCIKQVKRQGAIMKGMIMYRSKNGAAE
ncbi:hypothetical protein L21SP2_0388 [Salinispira pacifica]|uniref:Uncharacterized protein n=1 Tax=Salinispira pacifica TaxID=1307761 RepID=V5WDW8_9SPIO|nr:hypothetical protein L21SP2_0388 [Salinispira pacifica]